MSQFDANNPYSANAATQVHPPFPPNASQKLPGRLNVIAIFFLIFWGPRCGRFAHGDPGLDHPIRRSATSGG